MKPILETFSMKVVVERQMDTISQQLLLTLTLAPSGFHIEIILMSFHLSSEEEKALHAKLIFSAQRTIGGPTSVSNMRCHMKFYPRTCPSSLLVHLRSKLRDTPYSTSQLRVNDHLSS
ncbi:unnamed protein product [Prunus armeniaca]|uniref:Uncharacterized protein n=1 Tax=Prunus armeniaca TaxID=36596 RepID=A0A6J5WZK7_PRUAR|nr:unnamed protein product [Prunus armeniaca]